MSIGSDIVTLNRYLLGILYCQKMLKAKTKRKKDKSTASGPTLTNFDAISEENNSSEKTETLYYSHDCYISLQK